MIIYSIKPRQSKETIKNKSDNNYEISNRSFSIRNISMFINVVEIFILYFSLQMFVESTHKIKHYYLVSVGLPHISVPQIRTYIYCIKILTIKKN